MVDRSYENLSRISDLNDHINQNIKLFTADAWKWKGINIKYDAIHIGAGADKIPENLWKLLKEDGLMVLPIKHGMGEKFQVYRKKGISEPEPIGDGIGVRYVPLLKPCGSNNPNRRCHNQQII